MNPIGFALAAAWLFSGFRAAGFLTNRTSRGKSPAGSFSYLTLAALFLGPVVLAAAYLAELFSGEAVRRWRQSLLARCARNDLQVFDSRGREISGNGTAGNGEAEERAVEALKKLLRDALKQRASDVLIVPRGGSRQLQLRVNGELRVLGELSPLPGDALVGAVKTAAGMDPAERLRPQEGTFSVSGDVGRASLRAASVGVLGGEKLTLRLLAPDPGPSLPEEIGMRDEQLELMRSVMRLPAGLVLLCGPAGSGRTSTLYALLSSAGSRRKDVVLIEEHIGRAVENLSQLEADPEAGVTLCGLLRNALLQHPDIIGVDGIRDSETARLAVRAARSGHLVVAVIDGGDCAAAVGRLAELGVPPGSLADVLQLVVSQRLVRGLCDCAAPDAASPEQTEYLRAAGLPENGLRRPRGCRKCDGSGYSGRRAIFDMLVMDDHMRALFGEHGTDTAAVVSRIAAEHGVSVMAYEGYRLAASGITSAAEAERVISEMERSL